MNLSAVILAGGKSSRMGRDKAWVELNGKSLLALAVEKVRRLGVREIFISGRGGVDYAALGCPVLHDTEPDLGPLGGIDRGLCECRSPLLLVLAVDLPLVTTAWLRQFHAQCDALTGVVPEVNGALEPLAAIYPARCLGLARETITSARRAARDFAAACLREHLVRTYPVAAAEAGCFANWNRPVDLPAQGPA
jgi:molybdopterin-guanine dinucleotide biosynthesis protein A